MLTISDPNSQTTPAPTDTTALAPSAPIAPVAPPAALTAPPGTALEIAKLLAAGRVDTTQAGKLAKAGNIDTLTVARALHTLREVGEAKEDVRSPEVKALDAAMPPAKPDEFVIRAGDFGPEPTTAAERAQFDAHARTARTWLSAMGFSKENGQAVVNLIAKVAQQTQHMTLDQLETRRIGELKKMQRVHGEKLTERLQAYDDMLDTIDRLHPGVLDFLGSRGIGASATVVNMLLNHAPIYHARRKGR
jgi:hypothetical protein